MTLTEQQELEKLRKEEKTKRMDDSNSRKKLMQNLEDERKKNEKPSDLEEVSCNEYIINGQLLNDKWTDYNDNGLTIMING